MKNKCLTCNGDGVYWELLPCPNCPQGKIVKRLGKQVTKLKKALKKVIGGK